MAVETESLAAFLQGRLSLKDFEWEPNLRPCLPFNRFLNSDLIPEIDLQSLISSRNGHNSNDNLNTNDRLVHSLVQAAASCGFFQVFNHSISLSAVETLYSYGRRFFSLPLERKIEISKSLGSLNTIYSTGYMCGSPSDDPNKCWCEALRVASSSKETMQAVANLLWAEEEDQQAFSDALEECSIGFSKLAQQLTTFLLQGLGLHNVDEVLEDYVKGEETAGVKLNHYPMCPQPNMTLGLPLHSDVSLLTLLWQDEVAGLQVKRDGTWIVVKPRRDALVVNVGDIFQVWSNDRYQSGIHRVVLNEAQSRYSIGYFYNPSTDSVLGPLPKLLKMTGELPKFRSLLTSKYRHYVFSHIHKSDWQGVEYLRR